MKYIVYQIYFYFNCFTFTFVLCSLFTKVQLGSVCLHIFNVKPISTFTEQPNPKKHQLQQANVKLYWVLFAMMKSDFFQCLEMKSHFSQRTEQKTSI